jgi:peptidoglycan L-alanyl-D-glutamate endopeptidase CwlK
MATFSKASLDKLNSCHPDLQRLFNDVIRFTDCTILCGYRGEEEQNKAYAEGKSKAKFGESPHNKQPSMAVDVMPYPIDWSDRKRLDQFVVVVKQVADSIGVRVKWGGEFKGFFDGPHWELV